MSTLEFWLVFGGLFIFFLWCLISPFLPKESRQDKHSVIIHNNINISNTPHVSNDRMSYNEYKQLYYDPNNNKPRQY